MAERSLILVRHARAVWPTSGQRDFERELTDEGRRDAEGMAARLVLDSVAMDALVASPAPRAWATAILLAAAGDRPAPVATERLYEARVPDLRDVVRGFDDRWESPCVVGHNPGLSHFADWLLGEPTVLELPTCAVLRLAIPVLHWRDLDTGCASLSGTWLPPAHGPGPRDHAG